MKNLQEFAFIGCLLIASPAIALEPVTVISVEDGDTISVRMASGESRKIRMSCIDAAELSQAPHGVQARQRLQQIIPVGSAVNLKTQATDRYGRTVAEVFKGSLNVNLAMVQEGRAIAYRKYFSQCEGDRYLKAEASAKSRRLAFWSQANPIMPWDYRRGVRAAAPKPQPITQIQSNCHSSYPTVCIPPAPPDLDCSDIPHRRFKVVGSDPHRFDGGDRDGIGCER